MDRRKLLQNIKSLQSINNELESMDDLCQDKVNDLKLKINKVICSLEEENNPDIDFKEIVDNIGDGIYITDGQGTIQYINKAYSNHTHLLPEQLVGKTVHQTIDEGIFKKVASPEVLKSKQARILVGYIRTYNDKDIFGYCTLKPIFNIKNEIKHVMLTLYDTNRLKSRYDEFVRLSHTEEPIRIRLDPTSAGLEPIIGFSSSLKNIYNIVEKVAQTDATVLITGESGVGKEGVADYICACSKRNKMPFIKVNCTAIAPSLLESELFGYESGAFTGANSKGKIGLFEKANHGTILLDEIGDLPYDLQTKLLRIIQQKEIIKVGSTTPIKLDVRIIASTNTDFKKKMADGSFREDLYYRLSTIPIHVPPLRERREDIPEIISHYLEHYCKDYNRKMEFSNEYMHIFQRYDWPGNVRQLKNIVEYLVICSEEDYMMNIDQLKKMLNIEEETFQDVLPSFSESVENFEKMIITNTLKKAGSLRKAAQILKIDAATVSRKAKKYGIPLNNIVE